MVQIHRSGIARNLLVVPAAFVTRVLSVLAIIFGLATFFLDMDSSRSQRDAEAWQLISQERSGNSGKKDALEYLNQSSQLSFPNPLRLCVPLCAKDDQPTEVVLGNFGPWKSRTSLEGIDLSMGREPDQQKDSPDHNPSSTGVDSLPCTGRGAYLHGINLQAADLDRANFSCTDLRGDNPGDPPPNLTDASLRRATFSGAYAMGGKFTGATLERAKLNLAQFFDADFEKANLSEADMNSSTFEYARFLSATMTAANLVGSNLTSADFTSATLSRANLKSQVHLRQANFSNATLDGTDLRGADMRFSRGLTQSQIDLACLDVETKLPEPLKWNGRAEPCAPAPQPPEISIGDAPVGYLPSVIARDVRDACVDEVRPDSRQDQVAPTLLDQRKQSREKCLRLRLHWLWSLE